MASSGHLKKRHKNSKTNPLCVSKSDILFSEPVILGDVIGLSGECTIIHDGVTIKHAKSWNVGIPNSLGFTVDAGAFATNDLLHLYGPKRFYNCEIGLIVQRTIVEPQHASRPVFSKWHDHLRERDTIELTYQFSDALTTELRKSENDEAVSPHNNALLRMGAGIVHRSRTNLSNAEIMRTWGRF